MQRSFTLHITPICDQLQSDAHAPHTQGSSLDLILANIAPMEPETVARPQQFCRRL